MRLNTALNNQPNTDHLAIRQNSFSFALEQTRQQANEKKGIGTLNEKTIHAVLKNFYAPYTLHQEVKLGSYVVDIMIDQEIMEIQTRHFNTMRNKLAAFLPEHEVTIIYPITHTKWLSWINEATGEVTKKRKSPKTGAIYQIIPELYRIRSFLSDPHLHFILPLLDVEEYRLLNGWSHDGKRGSTRHDGFPCGLVDEIYISQTADYAQLLPLGLPAIFTSKDYSRLTKVPPRYASTALLLLNDLGIVQRIGKKGNTFLYEKINSL